LEVRGFPEFKDIGWRWIAYGTSAVVLGAIALSFFCEIELKQDVRCEIVSSSQTKIQGYAGMVSAIHVRPFQRVASGAPLFELTRDLSLSGDGERRDAFDARLREQQIEAATSQYDGRRADLDAQRDTARIGLAAREREVAALDAQIAQTRQMVTEAARRLDRLNAVADYVTAERLGQASADVHQAKVSLAQAWQRRQQLIAEAGALRGTQAGLDAKARELDAQHARDLQDIRLRFEQLRQNITVSAPRAGVVTFSSLVPGRMLDAGDAAVVIDSEPAQPLTAALRIPSRQRGFVREGQVVRIKFDAFPYARFGSYGARIRSISNATIGTSARPAVTVVATATAADAALPPDGGYYLAWATLAGDTFRSGGDTLRILSGMSGTASIVVERRTIAAWVLEPLFRAMRG